MCEKEIVMKVGAIFEIEWEFSVLVNTHYGAHTYTLKTATFPFTCFYFSTKCTTEHSFYVDMYFVCVYLNTYTAVCRVLSHLDECLSEFIGGCGPLPDSISAKLVIIKILA